MCVPTVTSGVRSQIHGSFQRQLIITHGEVLHRDLLSLGELLEGLSNQFVIHCGNSLSEFYGLSSPCFFGVFGIVSVAPINDNQFTRLSAKVNSFFQNFFRVKKGGVATRFLWDVKSFFGKSFFVYLLIFFSV